MENKPRIGRHTQSFYDKLNREREINIAIFEKRLENMKLRREIAELKQQLEAIAQKKKSEWPLKVAS